MLLRASSDDAEGTAKSAHDAAMDQLKGDRDVRLKVLRELPGSGCSKVYGHIQQLPKDQRGIIEAYNGPFAGVLCNIKNISNNQYLTARPFHGNNEEPQRTKVRCVSGFDETTQKCRVFGMTGACTGDTIFIYGIAAASYIYVSGHIDKNRRQVRAWIPGYRREDGMFSFIRTGRGTLIKNNLNNEYLFSDGRDKYPCGDRVVFTHRKGRPVSTAYWKITLLDEKE